MIGILQSEYTEVVRYTVNVGGTFHGLGKGELNKKEKVS